MQEEEGHPLNKHGFSILVISHGTVTRCNSVSHVVFDLRLMAVAETYAQEYIATVTSHPTAAQLKALRTGTEVDGVLVVPKAVQLLTSSSSTSEKSDATTTTSSSSSKGKGGGGRGQGDASASSATSGGSKAAGRWKEKHVIQIVVSEGRKHEVGEVSGRCRAAAACWV